MRDPRIVALLDEGRRAWAAEVLDGAGRSLPPAAWDPKQKKPTVLQVPVAPFDERQHGTVVAVPQSASSEQAEREWEQRLEFPNTFYLRQVHDEAALRIWNSLDVRKVSILLAECAPRFGLRGLDRSIEVLPDYPHALDAFKDFETPRLSVVMAQAFSRSGEQPEVAQRWLDRFPEAAVVGLVPPLLARGKTRLECVKALRHLRRHRPEAFGRGLGRYATEVGEAVIDSIDAMEVPTRKPALPDFASVDHVPWPITKDGRTSLQGPLLADALALLKVTPLEGGPWLDALRAQFDEGSLQRLAEVLLWSWLLVGGPPKEKWALYAAAHFPSEPVIDSLASSAAELASSSLSARAKEFVDVLAAMNTRASLKRVYSLSRKVRARAFRVRAELAFTAAAERMGMTHLELSERLVPDYGLSADGVVPVTPLVRLEFEGLKARFVDQAGKAVKTLPAVDDAELAADVAELKKKAGPLAREIADRLEQRMTTASRMNVEHFTEVYALHGIARQVARSVLFGVYSGERLRTGFVIDDSPALSPDSIIGIVHPLELDEAARVVWRRKLNDQPFEQLSRKTSVFADRAAFERAIRACAGPSVVSGAILGLVKRGWVRGAVEGGGCYWNTSRKLGGVEVVVEFEPGIFVGGPNVNPRQRITRVVCAVESDPSPVVMSELMSDMGSLPLNERNP